MVSCLKGTNYNIISPPTFVDYLLQYRGSLDKEVDRPRLPQPSLTHIHRGAWAQAEPGVPEFRITPDPPNQSTHDRSFVPFFSGLKKVSKWTKNLWLDSLLEEVFIGSPLDTGSNLLLVEAENLTLGPDKSACFGLSC